ncbi:recombinase family protein [Halobacterium salinarum]|uniref:recombinase family protein n=1 Tax=Halobacterium salinarum TaxID=2242 RepID=UPI0025556D8D|nr:recombinase family protein [Halobacterium salinarum]MDL0144528.1 recombinase family protein [Halobacterium salinarum]
MTDNLDKIKSVGIYVRVSTDAQDLEKQVEQLSNYADRHYPEATQSLYKDEGTGTDTERNGYKRLMDDLEQYDVVVVRSVSRVSRSISDLERTVDEFKENNTALVFMNEPIEFQPEDEDPYSRAMLQLLGVFAELEANMIQDRIKQSIETLQNNGFKWGRAPLGFSKNNGELIPENNLQQICAVLEMVDDDEMSQRKGAQRLDTSRTTIRRALEDEDRRQLYNLD